MNTYRLKEKTIHEINQDYRNHHRIIKIKENVKETTAFDFPEASTKDTLTIIELLNLNNAAGPDHAPLKINKTNAYTINKDLKKNKFSENAETAIVRSTYRKE